MKMWEARNLWEELASMHGLLDQGWKMDFTNSKRQLGCCWQERKLITLSRDYVRLNGIEEVRDTILHEIAHALAGAHHGHDRYWKLIAQRIGAKPERTAKSEDIVVPPAKFVGVCPTCEREVKQWYRRPKKRRSCGTCNPRCFDETHLLVIIER